MNLIYTQKVFRQMIEEIEANNYLKRQLVELNRTQSHSRTRFIVSGRVSGIV